MMKCNNCGNYTLKASCKACEQATERVGYKFKLKFLNEKRLNRLDN